MRYGFKASNGRDRKLDIRDGCRRLQIDLRAENDAEAATLGRIRRQLAVQMFDDDAPPLTAFDLTPVETERKAMPNKATPLTYDDWRDAQDYKYIEDMGDTACEAAWNARQPEIDALTAERDDLKSCGVVTGSSYDRGTGQTDIDVCENDRPCAEHPPEAWLTEWNRAEGAEERITELEARIMGAKQLIVQAQSRDTPAVMLDSLLAQLLAVLG